MKGTLIILISILWCAHVAAQSDTAYYNGSPILLRMDSLEPGYTDIEQAWPFKIYWYNVNGDKFGKLYNYYDKGFEHVNYQSLVKYNAPKNKSLNNEYFGKTTCFYTTGEKQAEYYVEHGKREGTYVYYWRNGKVKTEGTYKANNPVGVWKDYSKKGNLVSTRKP